MSTSLLHESWHGIDKRGQRYGVERIVEMNYSLLRFRYVVEIDSSYPTQSRITAYVWAAEGWREVARIHGDDPSLPETDKGYVPAARSDEKREVVEAILDRLHRVAKRVTA